MKIVKSNYQERLLALKLAGVPELNDGVWTGDFDIDDIVPIVERMWSERSEKFPSRVTDEMVEAAARAICVAQGYDKNELDDIGSLSSLPLWMDKKSSANAALEAAANVRTTNASSGSRMTDQLKRVRGRPRNGFDKKQYDRNRMKRIRAAEKENKSGKSIPE